MTTRTQLALGACLSIASFGAFAHSSVDGTIEASGGSYVNCLQTGSHSSDSFINACEGIAEEVAEVEETVVAQAPTATEETQTGTIDTRQFSEQTLFDTNSAKLNDSGRSVMTSLFAALSEYKGITGISITGHTDSRGSDAYNQSLSEQRAERVASAIRVKYPDARIEVTGAGETSPVASNDTAEGRQLNRRVEIEVTATRMVFN